MGGEKYEHKTNIMEKQKKGIIVKIRYVINELTKGKPPTVQAAIIGAMGIVAAAAIGAITSIITTGIKEIVAVVENNTKNSTEMDEPVINPGTVYPNTTAPSNKEKDIDILYQAAINNYEAGNWPEAKEEYETIISIDSTYLQAYKDLIAVLKELNEWDEAIKYLKELIKLEPHYYQGYKDIGFVFAKLNQWKEATYYLHDATTIFPGFTVNDKQFRDSYLYVQSGWQSSPDFQEDITNGFVQGIINDNNVIFKSEPMAANKSGKIIRKFTKGETLKIKKRYTKLEKINGWTDYWYLVEDHDGIQGYVYGKYLDLYPEKLH
jgi:tetratricopeptide (TPR) repeat protein